MPSREEIAWAAGLFEGEGSIAPMRQKNRHAISVIMHLGSTDQDVVSRFHEIVGVGNITIRDRPDPRHKRQYVWQSAAIADVQHVVRILAPWLCSRRLARAQEVLAEYDASPGRRWAKTKVPA